MKRALLLAAAFFAVAPAQAIDFRARSTSASHQFTIYCENVDLRGRVAGFVEEAKRDVLELIGERDRWRIPIVITIEGTDFPDEVRNPVTLRLAQTPEGPTIQIGVVVGSDPAMVHLQKYIMHAVLLDFIYRDNPPEAGKAYVSAPWWVVSGAMEKVRQRDFGINADMFKAVLNGSKIIPISDLLAGYGQDLCPTAAAFDDASAHAFVQLLIEQPEGKARLAKFLRDWPDAGGDMIGALIRAFPTLGPDEKSLQKWWTINVARFATSDRYLGLSMEQTDKELADILEFDVVVDKAGKKKRFKVGAFEEFIRLPGGRAAAAAQQRAIIALSTHCHALMRPVLVDYEQIFALLSKGRTRGIADRIHGAEVYRTTVLQRMTEITDYMNWFEATQVQTDSGTLDNYMRLIREFEAPPPLTPQMAAIKAYMDMLEDSLKDKREDAPRDPP